MVLLDPTAVVRAGSRGAAVRPGVVGPGLCKSNQVVGAPKFEYSLLVPLLA